MSVNHAVEAQRYLSKASWMRGDGPDAQFADPQTAAVLASLAQAHATLAHLPEQHAIAQERLEKVVRVVIDRVITMATHYEPELQRQANELMRDLDEAGVNIDLLVDERSAETGHGPHLCDMFGQRYDLTKQWLDRRGKRWEHTGSWSDVGGPVMRRDEPDGDAMVLVDLIREYGPLKTVTGAPKSPVVAEVDCPW